MRGKIASTMTGMGMNEGGTGETHSKKFKRQKGLDRWMAVLESEQGRVQDRGGGEKTRSPHSRRKQRNPSRL